MEIEEESRNIQEVISADANDRLQNCARKLEINMKALQEIAKITVNVSQERGLRLMPE